MYRNFFRNTSVYTLREGLVEAWRFSFSTPFLLSLFKTQPNQRSPYRSAPYRFDGATRRRFATSNRVRAHLLVRNASSFASISSIEAYLALTASAQGSSAVSLNFDFVVILSATAQASSSFALVNPHLRLFCNFEIIASVTLNEQKLKETLWRDVFLPPTTDVMSFASSDNRAIFLNSLLGALIQSTHPTEISNNKLDIRTIDDSVTLFERNLTFDENLKPIKKID